MKKVISISSDRNIFKSGSPSQARQIEYGSLFEELHIVVFTTRRSSLPLKLQIAPNVWVYGTNSFSKIFHIGRAFKVASKIITSVSRGENYQNAKNGLSGQNDKNYQQKFVPENSVITVQDPFEIGLIGAKLKKKFGLPLHVQIHTDFLSRYFSAHSLLNKIRLIIARKVLPQADAVRVVSQRIADSFDVSKSVSKKSNKNNGPVGISLKQGVVPTVLPIFVDIEKIEKVSQTEIPAENDLRKKYPQFNFIILMASRLTREKNIPLALKVFRTLVKAYPQTGMVIVGSGPEERRLKALVNELGIQKSCKFEPWQTDLVSYYKTANLFLVTSLYEGFGMTLIEAVASHCPVVSSDVGVAPVLLSTKVMGPTQTEKDRKPICSVNDEGCFYAAISGLLEDLGVREYLVHDSYGRMEQVVVLDKGEYLKKYVGCIEMAFKK